MALGDDDQGNNDNTYVDVEINVDEEDPDAVDDTMVSHFSTFSAVPNMTMFAKIGHSPSKHSFPTPKGAWAEPPSSPSARTPRAAAGPLPNRTAHYESGGNTTNLLDFTDQIRLGSHYQPPSSPRKGGRLPPSKTIGAAVGAMALASAAAVTPGRRQSIANLLDFDIPPLPTPRSIPTITPRELESLKSGFLSDISSLKASLSGKEAEVLALKTAVGDAEKRVGECMEQLREERGARQQLADEKDDWERRGRDMEDVLRKVKEEIVLGRRERDELDAKLDESEKRREAAEMMAQEAESKMAGMRAGQQQQQAAAAAASASTSENAAAGQGINNGGPANTKGEVELAVERVARELHAAYKSKHETKVAALKKSYEARWEKRVHELEAHADELAEENERLRLGRDATMTRVEASLSAAEKEHHREQEEERKAQAARDAAHISELGAEVRKLEAVVGTVKADNGELRGLLERERVEKGELVLLAEEMMSMQSFIGSSSNSASISQASAAAGAGGGGVGGGVSGGEKRGSIPAMSAALHLLPPLAARRGSSRPLLPPSARPRAVLPATTAGSAGPPPVPPPMSASRALPFSEDCPGPAAPWACAAAS